MYWAIQVTIKRQSRCCGGPCKEGHGIEDVQDVVRNLNIGWIDFRSDKDADVQKHTHHRTIQLEVGRRKFKPVVTRVEAAWSQSLKL
jgi:ERCC4-related helicase